MITEYPVNIVDRAAAMAMHYHFGQSNKHNGEPYILHCHRVYVAVRDAGGDEEHQATAWLHDVIEDTDIPLTELKRLMPSPVVVAVMILSKTKGESNEDYYLGVKQNEMARKVKLADMEDNLRRNHLIFDGETRLRMAVKYNLGFDILGEK